MGTNVWYKGLQYHISSCSISYLNSRNASISCNFDSLSSNPFPSWSAGQTIVQLSWNQCIPNLGFLFILYKMVDQVHCLKFCSLEFFFPLPLSFKSTHEWNGNKFPIHFLQIAPLTKSTHPCCKDGISPTPSIGHKGHPISRQVWAEDEVLVQHGGWSEF